MRRAITLLPITAATAALAAAVGLFVYLVLVDAGAGMATTPSIVRHTSDTTASPSACPGSRVYPSSPC
jgi:hypothetical protein